MDDTELRENDIVRVYDVLLGYSDCLMATDDILRSMLVRPEFQNQGIGSELVRRGLEACRRLGHRVVIVVGHPEYYPRFGFSPARAKGLELPFPAPDDAFLVLELVPED
jgi:putative acetyltransferase